MRLVAARLQSTREGGRAAYASHTPSLPNPHRPVIAQDPDHPAAPRTVPLCQYPDSTPCQHPMQHPDSTPCSTPCSTWTVPHAAPGQYPMPAPHASTRTVPHATHTRARAYTRVSCPSWSGTSVAPRGAVANGARTDVTFCERLTVTAGSRSVVLVHSAYSEARRTSGRTSLKFENKNDCLRRTAAGIKRKVDSVGWDACTATGSGKAGMCTHRVAHRCALRCERLGLPDVKARGGVEVVRFGHLQPTLQSPPSLGRYPASFSDMRPHDGKSPTGMREWQPAKPAKKGMDIQRSR